MDDFELEKRERGRIRRRGSGNTEAGEEGCVCVCGRVGALVKMSDINI